MSPVHRLSADAAAFARGSVSIVAASCGPDGALDVSRAVGCRVSADRARVSVVLSASQSVTLIEHIRLTGRVAVVVTEPSTHRALQLKGEDAVVEPRTEGDARLVAAYREAMVAELARIGFGGAFARTLFAAEAEDLVVVAFTPSAVFDQTPGPRAGKAVEAES